VLREKPFAMNAGDANEMFQAARSRGIHHLVNHEFHVEPAVVEMKCVLDACRRSEAERRRATVAP
jgi:predicted dehydrogenase